MTLRQTTKKIQHLVGVKEDGIWGPNTAAAVLNRLPDAVPLAPGNDNVEFDVRTEGNLATCQPGAVAKFRPFLRRAFGIASAMGVDAKVICGYRDKIAQEKAKALGASRAGWGYSWHNYGIAIDLGLFDGGSYADWDNPQRAHRIYAAIGQIAGEHGLEWGGDWTNIQDEPHFQVADVPVTPTASYREKLERGDWEYQLIA